MKSKIIALALFGLTAATVALFPIYHSSGAITQTPTEPPAVDPVVQTKPRVEVVFVLDTTGSMSGLIHAAKEKIWSIASTMASAQQAPEIKIGLVAYRDRGDVYVTRVVDLSSDLDSMYATLMDFQADGGGDDPESVNRALYDAVHAISWSQDPQTYKAVFLVGDAPPHMDYPREVQYPETMAAAASKGIVVNSIQCGSRAQTASQWRQIARLGDGRYFRVGQAGSAVAITTPFDEKLAELSAELDETRLYYGSEEEKKKQAGKVAATAKLHASSSVASRARRATFNASKSGLVNLFGSRELVEDVASGRVELSDVSPDELPEPMQALAPEEQEALVERTAQRRNELKRQIDELADQRTSYLKEKVAESGGAKDSLDVQIYDAVREQAAGAGLSYELDAPTY